MNIWYLGKDGDRKFFKKSGDVKIVNIDASHVSTSLGNYNAYSLAPGADIQMPGASQWYPLKTFKSDMGWIGMSRGAPADLIIDIVHAQSGRVVNSSTFQLRPTAAPVPTPLLPDSLEVYDVVIHAPAENTVPVMLGVMQNMRHEAFFDSARGDGIEIGPGINPRVKPSPDRNVTYLERYPQDIYLDFNKSYASQSSEMEALWRRYRVGNAHEIPEDLGQLDFIFSSHVIEHLPNPLGHFKLWRSRLTDSGRVFGRLPAILGCYDFMFHMPTEMSEWRSLYEQGDLHKPKLWQYDKYRVLNNRSSEDMAKEDIRPHFSFFTVENLSLFLTFCCENLGYSHFNINWAPNNVSIEFDLHV